MANQKNNRGKNSSNQGGLSIWVLLLIVFVALVGYGWYSGSFSNLFSSKPADAVHQMLGSDKEKVAATEQSTDKKDSQGDKKEETSTKDGKDKAKKDSDDKKSKSSDAQDRDATPTQVTSKGHARMAIVLDDFGYSNNSLYKFNELPIPLTYSVFPHKAYTKEAAQAGHAAGKQIMLHLPMESIGNVAAEKVTIRTTMSDDEIKGIVADAIEDVPHVVGVNNHQGSKASADLRVVRDVASVIQNYGLFFLDSRTNSASKIYSISRSMGVPTNANDLFIDNSSDIEAIKERLQQAANIAFKSDAGYIIVIGHDRINTYLAIKEMYRKLEAEGIEFVFVSSLMY